MITLLSFRTFVLSSLLFLFTSALGAQCAHPDYDGLEKFYLATNGDDWNDNTGWLTDCEPCGWRGVGCDENQRVNSLILRGNGLTGNLPEDFGALPMLRLINIGYNEVTGELPASLFELDQLLDIFFTGNKLTGNFPATFGSRTQLTLLRIGSNQLSGELPGELADFPNMSILALNGNNFTGSIPAGLGDLTDVFAIDLANNDLNGCFPEDMQNLCGNTRIRFGGNSKLSWKGDFTQLCAGSVTDIEQTGAPCDDGDPETSTDIITADCGCIGTIGTDGLVEDDPEVGGFNEMDEPGAERYVRTGNTPNTPGILPLTTTATSGLTAYPNPLVGGTLNIRLPGSMAGAEIRLLSLNGREITRADDVNTGFSLSMPVLEAGVYLLEATSGTNRSVTRVIVQ